ncbi:MAG TPA: acyl-CoA dehydrogenase family protein [Miltoncostaeaceae bacterium]|nr:acyl-CoA dehydrogenase family protein [Miltoncostaeaceae bacterium]
MTSERTSMTQADPTDLSLEQREIADLAFALGAKYADRRFDDHDASLDQWRDLSAAGLTGLSLPEEHGGAGGMLDLCIASERIAAGGFPAAKLVIATAIAGTVIARHGSEAQRARWLPGIAAGTTRFCFAFTEPEAGSNANRLRTRVTGPPGAMRLSGQKTYISALESSEAMIVVAADPERGGLTLVVLPLPCEGVSHHPVHMSAPSFEQQWHVFYDDVAVPEDGVLGERGGGGRVLFDGLNPERLIVAGQAVGVGRWCLARAAEYASQRVVFDVPIGAHQAVQHPLAEALIALEGAWLLVARGARLHDAGRPAGLESNMAKIAACDAGLDAADRALQCFGGSGYTEDTMMLQRFTYMRLLRTVPVARELALNHVATAGLGLPRSY